MIVQLQIAAWDKIYNLKADSNFELSVHDQVVIKTDQGIDLAGVIDIIEDDSEIKIDEDVVIEREATPADLKRMATVEEKQQALKHCYQAVKKLDLEMKLVDVLFSLDNTRITFAFVADGRVDFRALVKDLTTHFNKNIRLQQIGIRDEAKLVGDNGRCGRGLCCRQHLTKFSSVTGEMADIQGLGGRGSERISGCCGRLMCCLGYEFEGYKESNAKLPPIGTKVNVDGQKGVIVGHHILKESVDVKFKGEKGEQDFVLEIDLNRKKKDN
ncbi:MAG: regulatory iron-sulfur-containing complex subunit RicT [bacterium]